MNLVIDMLKMQILYEKILVIVQKRLLIKRSINLNYLFDASEHNFNAIIFQIQMEPFTIIEPTEIKIDQQEVIINRIKEQRKQRQNAVLENKMLIQLVEKYSDNLGIISYVMANNNNDKYFIELESIYFQALIFIEKEIYFHYSNDRGLSYVELQGVSEKLVRKGNQGELADLKMKVIKILKHLYLDYPISKSDVLLAFQGLRKVSKTRLPQFPYKRQKLQYENEEDLIDNTKISIPDKKAPKVVSEQQYVVDSSEQSSDTEQQIQFSNQPVISQALSQHYSHRYIPQQKNPQQQKLEPPPQPLRTQKKFEEQKLQQMQDIPINNSQSEKQQKVQKFQYKPKSKIQKDTDGEKRKKKYRQLQQKKTPIKIRSKVYNYEIWTPEEQNKLNQLYQASNENLFVNMSADMLKTFQFQDKFSAEKIKARLMSLFRTGVLDLQKIASESFGIQIVYPCVITYNLARKMFQCRSEFISHDMKKKIIDINFDRRIGQLELTAILKGILEYFKTEEQQFLLVEDKQQAPEQKQTEIQKKYQTDQKSYEEHDKIKLHSEKRQSQDFEVSLESKIYKGKNDWTRQEQEKLNELYQLSVDNRFSQIATELSNIFGQTGKFNQKKIQIGVLRLQQMAQRMFNTQVRFPTKVTQALSKKMLQCRPQAISHEWKKKIINVNFDREIDRADMSAILNCVIEYLKRENEAIPQ